MIVLRGARPADLGRLCLLVAMLTLTACVDDLFVSPAPGRAGLAIALSSASSPHRQGALNQAERARIRVTGPGVALDTLVDLTPAADTRVRLQINGAQDGSTYQVLVEIRSDSTLVSHGSMSVRLASGETATAEIPLVPAPVAARSLAVGRAHSCALDEFGAAYCWGSNSQGQLGTGSTASSSTPVAVAGNLFFTQIDVAFDYSCGLTGAGAVYCWGDVDGVSTNTVPVLVPGNVKLASITTGALWQYVCGLEANGAAHCFGDNTMGQLGKGDTISTRVFSPVSGGLRFRSISAGQVHTCGVALDGPAYCWGWNARRQTGSTSTAQLLMTPAPVTGGHTFTTLTAGSSSTCGTTSSATYCWGINRFGSLGQGSTASAIVSTPTQVVGGASFASVRGGDENSLVAPVCALTAAGAAFCWGANQSGQLGTSASLPSCTLTLGNPPNTSTFGCTGTPVAVAGGLTFVLVAPAADHTCGLTTDRRVFCWGQNAAGQLGNGTTTSSNTPVRVTGNQRFP